MTNAIPTYIINLNKRPERKAHILHEFANREEFQIHVITAVENKIGSLGLWHTLKNILQDTITKCAEFILVCEDDHIFTNEYTKRKLILSISEAQERNADILLGGISWFSNAIQVSNRLCWVEKFSGLQFTIIFKRFFQVMLKADFKKTDAADYKICSLTENKFFIHPFISLQKDFGYSDATLKNNSEGRVPMLFEKSSERIQILKRVTRYYVKKNSNAPKIDTKIIDKITIPTHIIGLPASRLCEAKAKKEFANRIEFNITISDANGYGETTRVLWSGILNATKLASRNKDDVIIICKSDHLFTPSYNKYFLISQIIQAHSLGCNILCGGIDDFNLMIPLTNHLYWIDSFQSTQFMVIFKKFFEAILNEPVDDNEAISKKLSNMTSHKMVIHPFISVRERDVYSDINQESHQIVFTDSIRKTSDRIDKIKRISIKFKTLGYIKNF